MLTRACNVPCKNMSPSVGFDIAAEPFCRDGTGYEVQYLPQNWNKDGWYSYASEPCPIFSVEWGKDSYSIAKGFEKGGFVRQRNPRDKSCDKRNDNIKEKQEKGNGHSFGESHGNPASGACCSWFVLESGSDSTSNSAKEEVVLDNVITAAHVGSMRRQIQRLQCFSTKWMPSAGIRHGL